MDKGKEVEKGKARGWEETVSDKKRAAIYARCSTAEQETLMQEAELKEYCERRGWEPILYRDKGPERREAGSSCTESAPR